MTHPVRLGVLTPSSNTALEPLTSALAAAVPGCSAHFSRFKVTEISLSAAGARPVRRQQDPGRGRTAGRRARRRHRLERHLVGLARLRRRPAPGRAHHASAPASRPPPRCWRSTNCWRCAACTGWRWSRPTPPTCSSASSTTTARIGIEVVAERHLGICVNHDFALVEPDHLLRADGTRWRRRGRRPSPPSAPTCAPRRWPSVSKHELDIPLLDTVSTTVWGQLRAAGADPSQVRGWGRLFGWR